MREVKNLIIGAGLAGIGTARKLNDCLILEANEKPFGHAQSYNVHGFYYDNGAHICHSQDKKWLKTINAYRHPLKTATVKNYSKGDFIGYPVQFNLKDLNFRERVDCLVSYESRKRDPNVTDYEQWCNYQYGHYITDKFYRIYTRKYWRTELNELDIDWLGGRVIPISANKIFYGAFGDQKSDTVFNEFRYPRKGGFEQLFQGLDTGLNIETNTKVVEIDSIAKSVKTSSGEIIKYTALYNSSALPDLIGSLDCGAPLIKILAEVEHNVLIQSIIYVDRSIIKASELSTWFYVYDEDIDFSRVLNMDLVSDDANQSFYRLQIETFRSSKEIVDIDQIAKNVISGIATIFATPTTNVILADIRNLGKAYVTPLKGLQERVMSVISTLEKKDIYSIGLYGRWKYIWSDAAYFSHEEYYQK